MNYTAVITLQANNAASSVLRTVGVDVSSLTGALSRLAAMVGGGIGLGQIASEATEFVSAMERSQLSIAATLMTFKEFKTLAGETATAAQVQAKAMSVAADAQEMLRVKAFSTTATFEELLSGFQKVVGAASGSKATTKDMVEFTATIANLATSWGVSFETISTQFQTVLLGISRTQGRVGAFMRVLGVTPDVLKSWREQGTILENVQKKLAQFEAIGPALNKTWAGVVSNLQDVMENVLGVGFASAVRAAKGELAGLTNQFVDIQKSIDKGFIVFNGEFMSRLKEASDWIGRMFAVLGPLAPAFIDLGVAAGKAGAEFVVSIGPLVGLLTSVVSGVASLTSTFGAAALQGALYYTGLMALGAGFMSVLDWLIKLERAQIAYNLAVKAGNATIVQAAGIATAWGTAVGVGLAAMVNWMAKLVGETGDLEEKARAGEGAKARINQLYETKGILTDLAGVTELNKVRGNDLLAVEALLAANYSHVKISATEVKDAIEQVTGATMENIKSEENAKQAIKRTEAQLNALRAEYEKFGKSPYQQAIIDANKRLIDAENNYKHAVEDATKQGNFTEIQRQKEILSLQKLIVGKEKLAAAEAEAKRVRDKENKAYDAPVMGPSRSLFDAYVLELDKIQQEISKANGIVEDTAEASNKRLVDGLRKHLLEKKMLTEESNALLVALQKALGDKLAREQDVVNAKQTGDWAKVWENINRTAAKGVGEVRNRYRELADGIADSFADATSVVSGIKIAILDIMSSIPSIAVSTAQFVNGVWESIGRGFESSVYALITGKANTLGDVLKGVFDDILKDFSKMITNMVKQWLFGKNTIEKDPVTGKLTIVRGGAQMNADGSIMGGSGAWAGALNTGGQYLGAAAQGYGYGSMVGGASGAPGFSSGAAIGGAVGAAGVVAGVKLGLLAGSWAGPIGAAVGAIIGAIIGGLVGVLVAPNTEKHLTGAFAAVLETSASDAATVAGRKLISNQRMQVYELFKGGTNGNIPGAERLMSEYDKALNDLFVGGNVPLQGTDTGRGPGTEYHGPGRGPDHIGPDPNDPIGAYTYTPKFDIAAGSPEDIAKTYQYLMENLIPKLALQAGFGQTGYAPSGNRDAPGGVAGLDYWVPGMDKDGNWLTKQLYDPNAPIPKMLAGIGFTAAKIRELATDLSTTPDPKAFLTTLTGIVTVVTGLRDLQGKLSKSAGTIQAEIQAESGRSYQQNFVDSAKGLVDLASELSNYSGDDQIAKAKELIALANQRYDEELAAIRQIMALQKSISESITAQLAAMDSAGRTPLQNSEEARRRIGEILNPNTRGNMYTPVTHGIGNATSPEEVQRYVDEARALISQLFDELNARLKAAVALQESLGDIAGKFGSMMSEVNGPSGVDKFTDSLTEITASVAAASKLTGDEQIESLQKVRDQAEETYQSQLDMLKTIKQNTEELTRSIADQIFELQYAIAPVGNEKLHAAGQLNQVDMITKQVMDLQGQLPGAKTPEEVARITGEIQQLINRYVGLFKDDDPRKKEATELAIKVLKDTERIAKEAYAALQATILSTNDQIRQQLLTASGLLSGTITSTQGEIEKLKTWLGELNTKANAALQGFVNKIVSTNAGLDLAMARTASLFTDVNTSITGRAGQPSLPDTLDKVNAKARSLGEAFDALKLIVDSVAGSFGGNTTEDIVTVARTSRGTARTRTS